MPSRNDSPPPAAFPFRRAVRSLRSRGLRTVRARTVVQACPGETECKQGGYTLAELVMVAAIIAILASLTLPVIKFANKRGKEAELRQALRSMRLAIDEHKRYSDAGLIPVDLGTEGYPSELEVLVEGIELVGQVDRKARFLRSIPIDPMTGEAEWGLRSFQDEPDSDSWGGENVFDVYSLSEGVGLNGVPYREW